MRRIPDRNIWVIYLATLLLGVAYGTSIAVLSIHLQNHGIPKVAMGGLAAAFAAGICALSLPAGYIVHRLGSRTTFAGSLLGYAVCVTSFPFLTDLTQLSVARFFDGAFSAGIWVAAETALLARSDRTNKAFVMSIYAVAVAIGYVVGPVLALALVHLWSTSAAFVAAGILATCSALVVLTQLESTKVADNPHSQAAQEEVHPKSELKAREVIWRIKTSCFATFAYGYFQASVVIFLPLYLIASKGVAEKYTILATAFFAAGMLSMVMVAGRFGDRHGHLLVMRVLASLGAVMVASFVLLSTFWMMCAAFFVAGATLASISPVSLALQGVVTPRADLDRANGYYNAFYAAGMLLGPPVSGLLYTSYGGGIMLFHLAGLWALFVVLSLLFASDDPSHARRARGGAAAMLR